MIPKDESFRGNSASGLGSDSGSGLLLPWGVEEGGTLDPRIPGDFRIADVSEPNLGNPLEDYGAALRGALDRLGPETWSAGDGGGVALVMDDPTRWTPAREALPEILSRLERAGVDRSRVTLSVGVGRHQAVTAEAMARRLGSDLAGSLRWFSPPVDDAEAYADLGETDSGLPVRVFKPVAEASLRVLLGSVLPHLQAGFGGGLKLIFPGCSHRSTLAALHRRGIGRGDDPGGLLGSKASENPMRRAVTEAYGKLGGRTVSVSHVLGGPGRIFRVEAGEPGAVQEALSEEARRRFQTRFRPPADIVAVGNWPWPGDPLQSFKALINHQSACKPGGVLAGFFWTDPEEIERSFPRKWLKIMSRGGAFGAWLMARGLTLADRVADRTNWHGKFMVHWARELVVKRSILVYSPPLRERLGRRLGPVKLFDDADALWSEARRLTRGVPSDRLRVRVFPRGGLTYCRPGRGREERAGSGSEDWREED